MPRLGFQTGTANLARIATLAALTLAVAVGFRALAAPEWAPELATISELEQAIHLPSGASPIELYTRYYAGVVKAGRRVTLGKYHLGGSSVVLVKGEGDLPQVFDGGCNVINVEYDVDAHSFAAAFCNGVA